MRLRHDETEPAGDPCPGECNRAWRKAEQRSKPHEIRPRLGRPVWCRNCQTTIGDTLGSLPRLAADCAAMPGGKLAQVETAGRFATRDGSPSGSPAWDMADEIIHWALSWEDALRDYLRHPVPSRPRYAALYYAGTGRLVALGPVLRDPSARRRLVDAVHYLTVWLGEWLRSPMALDAGLETIELNRRALRALGWQPLVHKLPLPCLQCDAVALQREDGSETVYCRMCDARWTWDDYDRLAAAYAHGRLAAAYAHGRPKVTQ